MIGGIFETIGKTLGGGKEKYFLELDDTAADKAKDLSKAAKNVTKAAKKTSADVAEKAQEIASSDVVEKAQDAAKAVAEEAVETAKKAVPAKKTSGKTEAKPAPAKAAAPAKAKKAAPTAATTPEDLIVNALAAASAGKTLDSSGNVVDSVKNFSTDYLMTPIRTSRRRPGPSLNGFKGMAKAVNPRLRG